MLLAEVADGVNGATGEEAEIADFGDDAAIDEVAHEGVEEGGGMAFEEGVAVAVGALGGDDIVALLIEGDELGEEFGWVLEIGVHDYDAVAGGAVDAGGDGGLVAEVAGEEDGAEVRIGMGGGGEEMGGGVGGAVVDEEEFVGGVDGGGDGDETGEEEGEGFLFVEQGDDDRQHGCTLAQEESGLIEG